MPIGRPAFDPLGYRAGYPVYGDSTATSARKHVTAAMRKHNNSVRSETGLRLWRDKAGTWRTGSRSLGKTHPTRAAAVAAFVRSVGPRQAQTDAARHGVDTRPKGKGKAGRKGTAQAPKRWAQGAIKHGGKLGGPGYLRRPAKDRRALLTRVVGDDGYRSAMSSLTFLLNVGKTTLTKTEKGKLEADKNWLRKTWGGGKTPAIRRPGKAKPKTRAAVRKVAGDFTVTIRCTKRGKSPHVETVEKGAYVGAPAIRADIPVRSLEQRLSRGLGFCPSVSRKAVAAVKEGRRVTLRHAGGRGKCVPAAAQSIKVT